jgi:hypothetical protein
MGVVIVIEICIKYPGVRTCIKGTDMEMKWSTQWVSYPGTNALRPRAQLETGDRGG